MLAPRACVVLSGGHWFLLPVSQPQTRNVERIESQQGRRNLCAVMSDSAGTPVLGSPGDDSSDNLLCA